jgi:hypothetical protein
MKPTTPSSSAELRIHGALSPSPYVFMTLCFIKPSHRSAITLLEQKIVSSGVDHNCTHANSPMTQALWGSAVAKQDSVLPFMDCSSSLNAVETL